MWRQHRLFQIRLFRNIHKAVLCLVFFQVLLLAGTLLQAQIQYEPLPTLKASEILPGPLQRGGNFVVDEKVRSDGFWNIYVIRTAKTDYEIHGTYLLGERIHEINALEELRRVDELLLVGQGGFEFVEQTGENLLSTATHPVATVEGLNIGLNRIFHKVKGGLNDLQSSGEGRGGQSDSQFIEKTVALGKDLSGISTAERGWAKKVGVDPYTPNQELRREIQRLAMFEASGQLAASFLIPIPRPIGIAATISGIAWEKDPEAIHQLNLSRLKLMGISEKTSNQFLDNHHYLLSGKTAMIESLHSLGDIPGLDHFVLRASHADSHQLATFFMISARLLHQYHLDTEPLQKILTDTIAASALLDKNRVVILYPVDYVVWTEELATDLSLVNKRLNDSYGNVSIELEMTGTASERTREEIMKLGWKLRENIASYDWLVSNPISEE